LMTGTLVIGSRMIRGLQTTQVARDAGHMYGRGVDFSLSGPQTMLSNLAGELGTLTSTGTGVVIFSTVTYVGRNMCKQAGYADASTPPNPTAACKNYTHFVFMQRWVVGNASLRSSNFGKPTVGVSATDGTITLDNYVTKTENRADAFTLLPKPLENGTDGYQAGSPAYLVEAFFKVPALLGHAQSGTYAFALF
jgi:hypothetical protein